VRAERKVETRTLETECAAAGPLASTDQEEKSGLARRARLSAVRRGSGIGEDAAARAAVEGVAP